MKQTKTQKEEEAAKLEIEEAKQKAKEKKSQGLMAQMMQSMKSKGKHAIITNYK